MKSLRDLFHDGEVTSDDLEWLQGKLLFDRVPVLQRYVRFFVLLFLSTVIATYGLVGSSTATVIGAMIVAPLMTPIMALSLSAISGDGRNIVRSFLTVASGTALVLGFAWLLAALLPDAMSIAGNSEISARTSPGLLDLIIAFAAGTAGAFATSREDISDALPGVAIAVSLVPPLCAAGVCLAARDYGKAWGAFILFLTNFLAITGAGLAVFAGMGFRGAAVDTKSRSARRWAVTAVVIATIAIMGPLGASGYQVTAEHLLEREANKALERWLSGSVYETYFVEAHGREVSVIIAGEGELPPFDELLSDMGENAGEVTVKLKVIPERTFEGTARP